MTKFLKNQKLSKKERSLKLHLKVHKEQRFNQFYQRKLSLATWLLSMPGDLVLQSPIQLYQCVRLFQLLLKFGTIWHLIRKSSMTRLPKKISKDFKNKLLSSVRKDILSMKMVRIVKHFGRLNNQLKMLSNQKKLYLPTCILLQLISKYWKKKIQIWKSPKVQN